MYELVRFTALALNGVAVAHKKQTRCPQVTNWANKGGMPDKSMKAG
jgi:hypothetical protein